MLCSYRLFLRDYTFDIRNKWRGDIALQVAASTSNIPLTRDLTEDKLYIILRGRSPSTNMDIKTFTGCFDPLLPCHVSAFK